VTILALAAVAAAGPGSADPVVVARQQGIVRQVVAGDGHTAWIRCSGLRGRADVWVARGRAKPRRIAVLTRRGVCEPQRLLGIARRNLLVEVPTGGRRQIVAVPLAGGPRRVLAEETPGPEGLELVAASAGGSRVAWIQVTGPATDRVAQVMALDLRRGGPSVVSSRHLAPEAVEPTGVWISPGGRVVIRERLRGAQYGYGSGRDRLRVALADGRLRTVAETSGRVRIVGASVGGRWMTYSVAREGDRRVWIYARDLQRGTRKRLRVVKAAPPRMDLAAPQVPTTFTSGSLTAWRERTRKGRRFQDAIRSARGLTTRGRVVERRLDVRGQRLFQSPPVVSRRWAVWAVVEFRRSTGWRGGYAGRARARTGPRSTIVRERI
jgi:hypothetical protein